MSDYLIDYKVCDLEDTTLLRSEFASSRLPVPRDKHNFIMLAEAALKVAMVDELEAADHDFCGTVLKSVRVDSLDLGCGMGFAEVVFSVSLNVSKKTMRSEVAALLLEKEVVKKKNRLVDTLDEYKRDARRGTAYDTTDVIEANNRLLSAALDLSSALLSHCDAGGMTHFDHFVRVDCVQSLRTIKNSLEALIGD